MIEPVKQFFKPSNRSLVRELVASDFKLRYKNSILGYFWSLLKPLMLFGVLYVVFTKIVKVGAGVPYYPAYLLLGLVLWTFFVEATMSGMNSIMARGDMIRKVSVPKYTIVVSTTMSAFVNFSLNMIVVFIFMLLSHVPFRLTILLAPLLIGELVVFSLAVASLLAALFVKFRDFSHIWEVALQILFYATPIIYPLTLPPARIAKLISISPLTQIFQDMRVLLITPQTLTTKAVFHGQIGRIIPLAVVAVVSVLGIWYFHRSSRNFAEEL
jgi:ABC-2 type transport system permease protein